MKPDLHMHTTSSDGLLSPRELVTLAAQRGVTIMAITDHDTFAGVDSLAGVKTEIPVITGVELSIRDMHGLHLLGYGSGAAPELRQVVSELAEKRLSRARCIVEKLTALGYPLDYDELCMQCNGSVGRAHIARALVAKGYISHVSEAFDRLIGNDGPAYVGGERLSMQEALALMQRGGFVPVLAHPAELRLDELTLRTLLASWQKQGLMGVEVYHPAQMGRGFEPLDATARRMGFLVTGGSDYHCDDGTHGQPGCTAASWRRAETDVQELLQTMARLEMK